MRQLFAIGLLAASAVAAGQVPDKLGYQGRLLRADGTPESGVAAMTFTLYDALAGGTALGCDAAQVALSDGYYSVFLGGAGGCSGNLPTTPIATSSFDGKDLYLEVGVAGVPLTPRQRIGSVAYALRSGTAVNVRGGTVEANTRTFWSPASAGA